MSKEEKKIKVVLDFSSKTLDGKKDAALEIARAQLELKLSVITAEIEKQLKEQKLENAKILKTEVEITVQK